MKLEVKHLAPYAPYGVRVILGTTERDLTAISLDSPYCFVTAHKGSREKQMVGIENVKPILRPLSDLPKQNGDDDNYNYLGIVNFAHAFSLDGKEVGVLAMPYLFIEELFKEHYDVFGLIKKGLAIDISDVVLADA